MCMHWRTDTKTKKKENANPTHNEKRVGCKRKETARCREKETGDIQSNLWVDQADDHCGKHKSPARAERFTKTEYAS